MNTKTVHFGKWTISYDPKPVPTRQWDWDYIHDDYDPENMLCGSCSSVVECLAEIIEIEFDES